MIDFKRLHELEKEVQDTHDKICNQVWLVHHIIGRDFKSDEYVLLNIDRVYEMIDEIIAQTLKNSTTKMDISTSSILSLRMILVLVERSINKMIL